MHRLFFTLLLVLGLIASPVLADHCALYDNATCAASDHHGTGSNDMEKFHHAAGCCHAMQAIRAAEINSVSFGYSNTSIPEALASLLPDANALPLLEPPSLA